MACPGSFLFGQRHAGGRDAPSDARDARLPGVCGLNGVLLPDARGSSPSVLCASCARLPAALVARELLVAVDLSKLISSERDGGDLLARMDRAESAWLNLLGRRLHGYPQADAGKIAGDESKSSTERIHSAESAVLAGRWTPALFAHLARKLADETETEREFWVLSPSERVGKDVVVLVFLNAVRLHQWKRSFKLWAGQAAADEAITNLDEPFLPLYPCPITGISTQKPTASAPAASAASTEPSFDPLVLHDSATRLSILLHALAGVPVSPTSTREILQLLVIWLDVWYAAVVDKAIVPITKTGSVVQGGGLVGNGDTEEDDEPDEFFPSSATNERDGLAVGTVICAVALLLKDLASQKGTPSRSTVFAQCCGKHSIFEEQPSAPSAHLIYTSFASSAVCVEHPHDHSNCSDCKAVDNVPSYLAEIGVAKNGSGQVRGSFVAVGSEGAKVNLNPLSILTLISMLPSKYFNPDQETTSEPVMDLSSLLARFPLSALPTPPIPPSPLMEMTPDQPENVWTDPLSNLYGYAAALQASLGIEIDANRDGGIGRFRDVLVVRGVEESSTREIYGAEVGDGAKKTKGEDKEAVGIKVGTHM